MSRCPAIHIFVFQAVQGSTHHQIMLYVILPFIIKDMQKTGGDILKSKKHFEILDGLRGIAALAIVIFHFLELAVTDYTKNFIAHGFLAVDFFFFLPDIFSYTVRFNAGIKIFDINY